MPSHLPVSLAANYAGGAQWGAHTLPHHPVTMTISDIYRYYILITRHDRRTVRLVANHWCNTKEMSAKTLRSAPSPLVVISSLSLGDNSDDSAGGKVPGPELSILIYGQPPSCLSKKISLERISGIYASNIKKRERESEHKNRGQNPSTSLCPPPKRRLFHL